MNRITPLFVAAGLVFGAAAAHAGLCDEAQVTEAKSSFERQKARDASSYATFLAQKSYLEFRLCKDIRDFDAFEELVRNLAVRRLKVLQETAQGRALEIEAAAVAREMASRKLDCDGLLKYARGLFDVGEVTRAEIDKLSRACANLAGLLPR
ncbi:MAG: hypothetical protein HY078_02090 [Elusimicrobia bacterium]|nr:hypothetical protein [Elusimicrobiota bacterium]